MADDDAGPARANQMGRREGERGGLQQRRGARSDRGGGLPPFFPEQPAAPGPVAVRVKVRGRGVSVRVVPRTFWCGACAEKAGQVASFLLGVSGTRSSWKLFEGETAVWLQRVWTYSRLVSCLSSTAAEIPDTTFHSPGLRVLGVFGVEATAAQEGKRVTQRQRGGQMPLPRRGEPSVSFC